MNKRLFFALTLPASIVCFGLVPKPAVKVCLCIEFWFASFIFISRFMKWKLPNFSRVILLFSLFSLAINIRTVGITLDAVINKNGGEYVAQMFQNDSICNFVCRIINALIFIFLDLSIAVKGATRIAEINARFTLDAMNNKIFDIQNSLNKQEISEEEADRQKKLIREEVDHANDLDGAMKFLSGSVKCTMLLLLVALVGGILAGIFLNKMPITDAVSMNMMVFFSNAISFSVPQIMVGIAALFEVEGRIKE